MANHPQRSVMQVLKAHPRVEYVDDERLIGNGVIITLRQGWTFDAVQDNRVSGEDTASKALASVRRAMPFAGPYDN